MPRVPPHSHKFGSGIADVTATPDELNLLDLSSLTVGFVLRAIGVSSAAWQQPLWGDMDFSTSDIADITTKSHTALTDIGSNTHPTIDLHLAGHSPTVLWSEIDKTVSSLADLATKSAAALTSGVLAHERGGLEADVSAYSGLLKITGGVTSSITDGSANWDTAYTHSQDNTQAHTDYLLNNVPDTMSANDTSVLTLENTNDAAERAALTIKGGGTTYEHHIQFNAADNLSNTNLDKTQLDSIISHLTVTNDPHSITWTQIDMTGSTIADLATKSAGDLTSGNLAVARMPTGGAWSLTSDLNIDSNTFVVDYTNNRVGIGTATPASQFNIYGSGNISGIRFTNTFNNIRQYFIDDNDNSDFIITYIGSGGSEIGLTSTGNIYLAMSGDVSIGATFASGKLHVDQASTTGAIPVLYLDQADVSEEMIEFNTTIGTGNAIEAIGAKTLTTTHFIKVTIPGGLTRYIPCGTIS